MPVLVTVTAPLVPLIAKPETALIAVAAALMSPVLETVTALVVAPEFVAASMPSAVEVIPNGVVSALMVIEPLLTK